MGRRKKWARVDWQKAPDIQKRVEKLATSLDLDWIQKKDIYCFRSSNSASRAYARIWGLSKIWQMALGTNASYCIEVLAEKFDKLQRREQDKVLLHELAHIPKNFSGSLLPHVRKKGKRNFDDRVRQLIGAYDKKA